MHAETATPAASCPMHGLPPGPVPAVPAWPAQAATDEADERALKPTDRLRLRHPRRMVVQFIESDDSRELVLFYGSQEISFDEPELFTFGQTLATQTVFSAGEALAWGEPGDWQRVRGLLEALIEAGVLQLAAPGDEARDERRLGEAGVCPSPLPPARSHRPRDWNEGAPLLQEICGRPLETGWLELVVPIFRVAHMALDAEGRQVGEANVFPPSLRLDLPTRWRSCIYPGSRHQHDKPMNVTALKAMRVHWRPMMAMLLKLREAYLQRCPEARAGWTVGHLERFSTAVLTLPAWQLMRAGHRLANGRLHPVLSSLFRVTDGLRMTMHHMLFIPFGERTRRPDTPMSAAEVYAYAERAFSFIGDHGVCAGPKAMIDEFLAVAVDGRLPRDGLPDRLDEELQQAADDIAPAIDYAMLGLKAYAAVFSLWPMTMRAYEALAAVAEAWWRDEPAPAVQVLRDWLRPIVGQLRSSTHLATEVWRADRERVYGDMYAMCHRTLTGALPAHTLAERLAPRPVEGGVACMLARAVEQRFGPAADDRQRSHRAALAGVLGDYLQRAQAVVRLATELQADTNRHLGREQPQRPFMAADIDLYVQLAEETAGRVPFLLDELPRCLPLRADVGAAGVALHPTESAGKVPAEPRALGTHPSRSVS